MNDWDKLMDPAREALEALIAKGDEMADRIEELEAKLDWVLVERDETFALMLDRAQTAEAKLAKAVEALEKLNVGEGWAAQIARTTLAELKGGKDE